MATDKIGSVMPKTSTKDYMRLYEAIERLSDAWCPDGDNASALEQPSRQWDLNTSFIAARRLAEDGWQDKAGELEGYMVSIKELADDAPAVGWDVAGETVDIGRYLDGEPECMLTFSCRERNSVQLLVNNGARCNADAPRLLNRGIAIATLVYTLQANGIGVALWLGDKITSAQDDGDCHETRVEINTYSEYIDPSRLAFWLGHPAAFRRCFFRFLEQQSGYLRHKFGFYGGRGYGYPSDYRTNEVQECGAVYIPFPETKELEKYETPQRAYETIRRIVAPQGILLKRE